VEINHHAILFSVGIVAVSQLSPKQVILRLCDFLDYPVLSCPMLTFSWSRAQVKPLDRFVAQTTCFWARRCILGLGWLVHFGA